MPATRAYYYRTLRNESHDRAMFGEDVGQVLAVPAATGL
jgi:hypothetical protein